MMINRDFTTPIPMDRMKKIFADMMAQMLFRAKSRLAAMDPIRSIQKTGLQLGLYCLLVAGCLGAVVNGSKLIVDQIHAKMFEMGYEVAKQNLPKKIETASIRSTLE